MRGKVERRQRVFCGDRITPAYAGKRAKNTEKDMHTQDHPRLCGEKKPNVVINAICAGSPPPMRGKGASWKCLIDCKGITPAYAGKSLCGCFYA